MTKNKRFENRLNKDIKKFHALNPVWDNEKQDALNIFEMIDLLNELNDENNKIHKENYGNLDGLNYYQEENASLSEKLTNLEADYDDLIKENEQFKKMLIDVKRILENELNTVNIPIWKHSLIKSIVNELRIDLE